MKDERPVLHWEPKVPTPRAAAPTNWLRLRLIREYVLGYTDEVKWKLEDIYTCIKDELSDVYRAHRFKQLVARELNRYELEKYTSPKERTIQFAITGAIILIFMLIASLIYWSSSNSYTPHTRIFLMDPVTNEIRELETD